jgi:Ca2+/H+ antiporter, TMEM165/GDT1 family
MDPLFISTGSVAVGKLGDKTRLLSLILATRLRKPAPIIAGIFVATLINHLIGCSVAA